MAAPACLSTGQGLLAGGDARAPAGAGLRALSPEDKARIGQLIRVLAQERHDKEEFRQQAGKRETQLRDLESRCEARREQEKALVSRVERSLHLLREYQRELHRVKEQQRGPAAVERPQRRPCGEETEKPRPAPLRQSQSAAGPLPKSLEAEAAKAEEAWLPSPEAPRGRWDAPALLGQGAMGTPQVQLSGSGSAPPAQPADEQEAGAPHVEQPLDEGRGAASAPCSPTLLTRPSASAVPSPHLGWRFRAPPSLPQGDATRAPCRSRESSPPPQPQEFPRTPSAPSSCAPVSKKDYPQYTALGVLRPPQLSLLQRYLSIQGGKESALARTVAEVAAVSRSGAEDGAVHSNKSGVLVVTPDQQAGHAAVLHDMPDSGSRDEQGRASACRDAPACVPSPPLASSWRCQQHASSQTDMQEPPARPPDPAPVVVGPAPSSLPTPLLPGLVDKACGTLELHDVGTQVDVLGEREALWGDVTQKATSELWSAVAEGLGAALPRKSAGATTGLAHGCKATRPWREVSVSASVEELPTDPPAVLCETPRRRPSCSSSALLASPELDRLTPEALTPGKAPEGSPRRSSSLCSSVRKTPLSSWLGPIADGYYAQSMFEVIDSVESALTRSAVAESEDARSAGLSGSALRGPAWETEATGYSYSGGEPSLPLGDPPLRLHAWRRGRAAHVTDSSFGDAGNLPSGLSTTCGSGHAWLAQESMLPVESLRAWRQCPDLSQQSSSHSSLRSSFGQRSASAPRRVHVEPGGLGCRRPCLFASQQLDEIDDVLSLLQRAPAAK